MLVKPSKNSEPVNLRLLLQSAGIHIPGSALVALLHFCRSRYEKPLTSTLAFRWQEGLLALGDLSTASHFIPVT